LKSLSAADGLYFLGRFGEWEYYNMDKAMEAAMEITAQILD
jgi:UDP-galactopyranose mutase